MHIVIVRGLWVHHMRVFVGDSIYWSIILCLSILCGVGIYFAYAVDLPVEVRWTFGILFGLLFIAASHNQGFLWNGWMTADYTRNGHHRIGQDAVPQKSNILIGLFMYADRLLALALLILGLVYFEDLGGGVLQVVIFIAALCFYIGSWAAYLDPPAMHEGRCYLLRSTGRWYALMTNLWHLTLAGLLLSFL